MSDLTKITLYIVIIIVSAIINTGLLFGQMSGMFPAMGNKESKQELGHSILFGLFSGLLGPIGVIIVWLSTGFGAYGWRIIPNKD